MGKMLQSFSPESDGWQFMWIILVVFIIGLGFSIERIIYVMLKSGKGRADFLKKFGQLVSSQQYDQALSFAEKSKLPIVYKIIFHYFIILLIFSGHSYPLYLFYHIFSYSSTPIFNYYIKN